MNMLNLFILIIVITISLIVNSYVIYKQVNIHRRNIILKSTININDIKTFQLENPYIISDFISSNNLPNDIIGVYVIENTAGDVLYINSSNNVFLCLKLLYEKFGSTMIHIARIQSFTNTQSDFMKEYCNKLISLSEPIIKPGEWENVINPSNNQNKFDLLKSKVLAMRSEESNEIISPFQSNTDSKVISLSDDVNVLELNYQNVDKILNEVRPYLIADGGNVSVVSVDPINSIIQLELQGACGDCPSSTTTMKMGIERILKESYPYIKSIETVNKKVNTLTNELIQETLAPIMSTITKLGGQLNINNVNGNEGIVTLEFKGPVRLKQGIQLILKDLKQINQVVFNDITD